MAYQTIYLEGPACNDSARHHAVPDAAVRGNMLFTGGISGFDPDGSLPETHEDQAQRISDRFGAILAETGFTAEEIGHWFVWSPDRHSKVQPINPVWERWFPVLQSRPARHAIARQLDPKVHYRIEAIGVRNAARRSYEINDRIYHTGMTDTPGFIPFGTTVGDVLFSGPTYGMHPETRKVGASAAIQAELCARSNAELFAASGHTPAEVVQMFVWYHDADSREAALRHTDQLYPNRDLRPAIHYIQSKLPFWAAEVQGQFLVQYDLIAVRDGQRRTIDVEGVRPMDWPHVPGGVATSTTCFTSVCLGSNADGVFPASLKEQTARAFRNSFAVIEAAGFARTDVGHAYVWYADHSVRDTVDAVWLTSFPRSDQRPARHCVVADLPAGALVGVELSAARDVTTP